MKVKMNSLPILLLVILGLPLSAHATAPQSNSVEFSDFQDPKRVGVDPFVAGKDTLIVGFDLKTDGS